MWRPELGFPASLSKMSRAEHWYLQLWWNSQQAALQNLLVNQLRPITKSPGSVRDSRRQGRRGRKEPWYPHPTSQLCSQVHPSGIPHPRISSEREEWRRPPEHRDQALLIVMHCAIFLGILRRVLRRAGSRVGPRVALFFYHTAICTDPLAYFLLPEAEQVTKTE